MYFFVGRQIAKNLKAITHYEQRAYAVLARKCFFQPSFSPRCIKPVLFILFYTQVVCFHVKITFNEFLQKTQDL